MRPLSNHNLKTLIGLFAVGILTTGCTKNEGCTDASASNYDSSAEKDNESCIYDTTITETATTNIVTSSSEFSGTINGVSFKSQIPFSVLLKDTLYNMQELGIGGMSANNIERSIVLYEMGTPEAFSIGDHTTVQFFRISGENESIYTPISSTVHITTSDPVNKLVSGTYVFRGHLDGDTINVINGVFTNIKYDVGYY